MPLKFFFSDALCRRGQRPEENAAQHAISSKAGSIKRMLLMRFVGRGGAGDKRSCQ